MYYRPLGATLLKTPGISEAIRVNLAEEESIDKAFDRVPEMVEGFPGCAGLSGVQSDWWTTFTVNFVANKYMTEAYIDKRMPQGGAIAYFSSIGGMYGDKYPKEYQKILEADTRNDMIQVCRNSPRKTVLPP